MDVQEVGQLGLTESRARAGSLQAGSVFVAWPWVVDVQYW